MQMATMRRFMFAIVTFACWLPDAGARQQPVARPACSPATAKPHVDLLLGNIRPSTTVDQLTRWAFDKIEHANLSLTGAMITLELTPGTPATANAAHLRAFSCAQLAEAATPAQGQEQVAAPAPAGQEPSPVAPSSVAPPSVASSPSGMPAATTPAEPPPAPMAASKKTAAEILGVDIVRVLNQARQVEMFRVAVPARERATDLSHYNVMSPPVELTSQEIERMRQILLRDPTIYLPANLARTCPAQPELLFDWRDEAAHDSFDTAQIVLSGTCMAARFMLNKDPTKSLGLVYFLEPTQASLEALVGSVFRRADRDPSEATTAAKPPANDRTP